jgi:hypothetical protein
MAAPLYFPHTTLKLKSQLPSLWQSKQKLLRLFHLDSWNTDPHFFTTPIYLKQNGVAKHIKLVRQATSAKVFSCQQNVSVTDHTQTKSRQAVKAECQSVDRCGSCFALWSVILVPSQAYAMVHAMHLQQAFKPIQFQSNCNQFHATKLYC